MNCAGSNEWWQRGLDGEPVPRDVAAELERHLADCPSCHHLHGLANLFAGPRLAFDRPMPPADFAGRLVRVVQQDRRRRQRRLVWAVAAAASFLLAGLAYFGLPLTRHGSPAPSIAHLEAPPMAHPASSTTLGRSVEEAGSALVSLTRRTADKTLADGRLLLPDVRPPAPVASPALLERTLETPAASLRQASTGLSTGLEPVAASARRAVQLFWQDMSPMGSSRDSGL